MTDTGTAMSDIPPLNIMHLVNLPGLLGGIDLTTHVGVHLNDRELFDAIAERYDATPTQGGGTDQCPHTFLRFDIDCDDQKVTVYWSEIYTGNLVEVKVHPAVTS